MKESHDARKDPKMFLCWLNEVYGNQYVCDLNIEQVILAYEHSCLQRGGSVMRCVLQTLTQGWQIREGECEISFIAPAKAHFLGFSLAADKEARNGSFHIRFNENSLSLPLVEALYKKHMTMGGLEMPMKLCQDTSDLCMVLPDGEHPTFDLSDVEKVLIENKEVIIKITGSDGLTGVVTLLVESKK